MFLPHGPKNNDLFENKIAKVKQIYRTALNYSGTLDNRSTDPFAKWC